MISGLVKEELWYFLIFLRNLSRYKKHLQKLTAPEHMDLSSPRLKCFSNLWMDIKKLSIFVGCTI